MVAFEQEERPPEERPPAEDVMPDDEPVTAEPDPAEPAGDQDAGNEAERDAQRDEAAGDEEPAAEDPLAEVERRRDEYLALAQRTQADFENFRKRAAKEAAAAGDRAKGNLVRELLPVVDNLERAVLSAGDAESDGPPGSQLAEGVRLVHSELIATLERHGVSQYDPAGQAFDPAVHEALSTRSEDGAEPGVVLDVVEKGYEVNGTVLRPARVVVSG